MRNLIRWLCAALIALAAALSGCGGGGGGGDAAQAPAQPASSPTGGGTGGSQTQVTCPDGSTAASNDKCPAVKIVSSTPAAGSTADPAMILAKGITVNLSGTIDATKSVTVKLLQGPLAVAGTVTLGSDNKSLTWVPTMRPAYTQGSVNLIITAIDIAGQGVNVNFTFGTQAMSCTDNTRWSNPAGYVPLVQNCVAPIGVQAILDSAYNKMTDTSCTVTVGQVLSAACQAYLANGTFALTNTGTVIASGHAPVWGAWFGADGSSNLMVLDSSNLNVVATMTLPKSLLWEIGNPTGDDTGLSFNGLTQNMQFSWDGTKIASKCQSNCS